VSRAIPTLPLPQCESAEFVRDLGAAFRDHGFVIIAEHGIPQPLIERSLAMFREFFALPTAVKQRFHIPGGGGARGYTPFGIETAKDSRHFDLKEFWHWGRELPVGHPYRHFMADNLSVDDLSGFRDTCTELFTTFDLTGRRLLRAIARVLELPADFFEDKVQLGNSVLRVIHYPPLPPGATEGLRSGAHEDINVITLLLGAEEAGLQAKTVNGHWHSINPPPDSMVINVGDMLSRLTNGVLPSTTHRVVNPSRERAHLPRYSIPFFMHFAPEFLIRTMPSCVSAKRPDLYPKPITAQAFLEQRLKEIRLT